MSNRKKPCGEAFDEFIRDWQSATPKEKNTILVKKYGISYNRMSHWVSEGKDDIQPHAEISIKKKEDELPKVLPLPKINLIKFTPHKKSNRHPETQCVVWSDHQAGEITPTYNSTVYRQRMEKLVKSTLSITDLHRNMYPINDLVIFLLGDMMHGENPHQGGKIESVECGALSQISDIALPTLLSSILSLKKEGGFKTVRIECVRGNHGRYDRSAPDKTNWDTFLYKSLKISLSQQEGFSVDYSDTFYKLVDIEGFKFFLFHGNQVQTYQGIPFYGLKRKVLAWHVSLGPFSYAACGHWHDSHNISISSETELFMNGALPTDDQFALEVVGTSSAPKQWTFGVHKNHGVTWRYPLIADDKFWPKKVETNNNHK